MWQKDVNELLEQFSGNCAFMNASQSCVGVVFKFGWLWLNPTFMALQKHLGEKESTNQEIWSLMPKESQKVDLGIQTLMINT